MQEFELILRLIIAAALGGIIGLERESVHKPAGLRTHMFVAVGAALFTILSVEAIPEMYPEATIDPTRMISAILTGIGFLGAGVIIHKSNHQVEGITTAAGLWMASGIGIATGIGYYVLSVTSVIISLIILLVLGRIHDKE